MTIPILLLHGLFGDLSVPAIVRHFGDTPVHAPALLGYGEFRDHATDGLTLDDQVEHVARWLRTRWDGPVHLVGHSVGGVVAMLFTRRYGHLSYSLTSVEGNFTLKDAFWTGQLSKMPLAQVEALLASYQADPAGWLARSGVPATPWTLDLARSWLSNQPASTLRAQARAVVGATAGEAFPETVRSVADARPIHLLSGGRSQDGWDVPDWLRARAQSDTVIPDTGHMMMMEEPERFAAAILGALAPRRLDVNIAEMVRAIESAWADAVAPLPENISRPTYDDEGVSAYFAGKSWRGHPAWKLRRLSFAPGVLTPHAFAWLLPAYMIAELEEPHMCDTNGERVLFKLSSIAHGDDASSFLDHLDRRQRDVVVRFLIWYNRDGYFDDDEIAPVIAMLKA